MIELQSIIRQRSSLMNLNPENNGTIKTLHWLYSIMVTAREIDILSESYTARGEAFFHVSGGGHEASAALAYYLQAEDWLHCHYRDKALMLARGMSAEMFFLSLFNKDASHSRGRQMIAQMSAPHLNILSMGGPVGNAPLQSLGVANVIKEDKKQPIVLCSMGEGTTQESETLESFLHAAREQLPILFLIEDNTFAISTSTKGKTFYTMHGKPIDTYVSIPIHYINGRFPDKALQQFGPIIKRMRKTRRPEIVIFSVERLDNHTNADDQTQYRSKTEISQIRQESDPIKNLYQSLLENGEKTASLDAIRERVKKELTVLAKEVQRSKEPTPIFHACRPLPYSLQDSTKEYRGTGNKELTMIGAIRNVLDTQLAANKKVKLFGEDIEDPKGDVFGLTKGLSSKYPGRVVNSPLSESLIVGVLAGEALAGRHPVGFFQFADFLPIGFNQIYAELGSMYWRTDGNWQVPMILLVSCGAYKPGLGPFHAASMEATVAHIPGIDVLLPSTAADAAGLLNMAFESKRPTIFFYPKNLLNNKSYATSIDVHKQFIPIGIARTVRKGNDITFVAYGNTVELCLKTARELEQESVTAEVIDLRSIMPWDKKAILKSAKKTERVLIVYEDNISVGFGAEIAAYIAEHAESILIRRVARPDTFVPCNFANQLEVLPSYKSILEAAIEMLGGTITWKKEISEDSPLYTLEAIGTSPADESVTIIEWHVDSGASVQEGDLLAELEADKASFELKSPVTGTLKNLLVKEGNTVPIGQTIAEISLLNEHERYKPIVREDPGTPIITLTESRKKVQIKHASNGFPSIIAIEGVRGNRIVENKEIAKHLPEWNPEDIEKRTGIVQRRWIDEKENALTLAVTACKRLLEKQKITLSDVHAIICSTGTPLYHTPSMATLIQYTLGNEYNTTYRGMAYDVSAACTGYLYALHSAYTLLEHHPDKKVLVVTTEVLSSKVDPTDYVTAPLFADAATATLVGGSLLQSQARIKMHLPVLSAQGENPEYLKVPIGTGPFLKMKGGKIFSESIRNMVKLLFEACKQAGLSTQDLDLLVPHQANQRIIDAIGKKIKLDASKVFSNLKTYGNTSSNTIPLCLSSVLKTIKSGKYIGLVAFGGGFTFGGMILQSL